MSIPTTAGECLPEGPMRYALLGSSHDIPVLSAVWVQLPPPSPSLLLPPPPSLARFGARGHYFCIFVGKRPRLLWLIYSEHQ
jgi:hypothetical protein